MYEEFLGYLTWVFHLDNFLALSLMTLITIVGLVIVLVLVLVLVVVPTYLVLKFLILTPLGWVVLIFIVWMYGFENNPRPGYGVDASFVKMCARTKSCNKTLHARDKITELQTEKVRPSKNITPVQE
jgi:hypothetical protein